MANPVKIWRDQKNLAAQIGKKGKIISWTIVRVPPAGFEDQAPYPVAVIKLEDGEMIIAQVVDYSERDLRPGRRVMTLVRRASHPKDDEVISYSIKAKPI